MGDHLLPHGLLLLPYMIDTFLLLQKVVDVDLLVGHLLSFLVVSLGSCQHLGRNGTIEAVAIVTLNFLFMDIAQNVCRAFTFRCLLKKFNVVSLVVLFAMLSILILVLVARLFVVTPRSRFRVTDSR